MHEKDTRMCFTNIFLAQNNLGWMGLRPITDSDQ